MPLQIQDLICNVIILRPASDAPAQPPLAPAAVPAAEALVPDRQRIPPESAEPEAGAMRPEDRSTGDQPDNGTAGRAAASGPITPRAVADRVYRLMMDELALARERE